MTASHPTSPPPKRLRRVGKKTVVGGVLGLVVAGLLYLGSLLPSGLGFGLGAGSGNSNSTNSENSDPSDADPPKEDPKPQPPNPFDRVYVVVEGNNYKVLKASVATPNEDAKWLENYRESSLKEILEMVSKTPEQEGVRIEIRKNNSMQPTISALTVELAKLGLIMDKHYLIESTPAL